MQTTARQTTLRTGSLLGLATLAALGLATHPAQAQTVFTSQADFQSAAGSLSGINFNGLVPAGGYGYYPPPGLTVGGVNFNTPNSPTNILDVTSKTYYGNSAYASDILQGFLTPGTSPSLFSETITLPNSATAVGIDYGTFNGTSLLFTFSNGDTYTALNPVRYNSVSFLGFTTATPFSSFTISGTFAGNETLVIEDLQHSAAPTPAPEPSSVAAFAFTGLGAAGLILRARKRKSLAA